MKFYCWYDNGTGWFEGPYYEDHPDGETARKKNDIGYGAYVSQTNENPNSQKLTKQNLNIANQKAKYE